MTDLITTANPESPVLIGVRQLIANGSYEDLFSRAKEENWDAERLSNELSDRLAETVDIDRQMLAEATKYVADEFLALDNNVLVIVDRTTGKQIAAVDERAIWTPPITTREDGRIVQPLPRLHPEVESGIIGAISKKAHETDIMLEKTASLVQTPLQEEEGDARLAILTKEGRKSVINRLRHRITMERSLYAMLRQIFRGTISIGPMDDAEEQKVEIELEGRVDLSDLKSVNPNFDFCASMERSLAIYMTHQVITAMDSKCTSTSNIVLASELELFKPKIWVVPASQYTAVKPHISGPVLLVDNIPSVLAISDTAMSIVPYELGESLLSFEQEHAMLFKYRVQCRLYWKLQNIQRLNLQGAVDIGLPEVLS